MGVSAAIGLELNRVGFMEREPEVIHEIGVRAKCAYTAAGIGN